MVSNKPSSPRKTKYDIVRSVEREIAAYNTVERKRAALRRALQTAPKEPGLRQMFMELLRPSHFYEAAAQGVFINYGRSAELYAIELADDLQRAGIRVWLDIMNMPDEGDWRHEVGLAMRSCGLMLMIVSPETYTDDDLRREWQTFLNSGKIVIPILYNDFDSNRFNLWVPPVDFRYDYRIGLKKLLHLLLPQDAQTG